MKQILLKLSPLFFLLLFFSCAKDQELLPVGEETEMIQALHDGGKTCDVPCQKPDFISLDDIDGCSASLSWGFNTPICGTFVVQLQNLNTGEWTHYNSVTSSPLLLTDLDACTPYLVGVSHVTRQCASLPLQLNFVTDCRECKKECEYPCKPLDFHYADAITETGATIYFGLENPFCGHFVARLRNNATGVSTTYDPALSPLVLTDLSPCTSYTIAVSHVTDLQACWPSEVTFTTECNSGPCVATGLNPQAAFIDQFGFDIPGHIDYADNHLNIELYPSIGYRNVTDPILQLEPDTDFTIPFCYAIIGDYDPADTDIQMWIDFDDDGEFEANELVIDYFIAQGSGSCILAYQPENIPTEGICGVPGRIILSIENEITSPCDDVLLGQVVDFLVNIGECVIDP